MKLDRNVNSNGRGKYAIINLRTNLVEWGDTPDQEFFVIKLKDKYAEAALMAYANAANADDSEYAHEVRELALRAKEHPLKRRPD